MAGRGSRAFGILLVAGFLCGFCLSSGSAHYFGPAKDAPGEPEKPGNASQGSGGGGGKEASERGGAEREGHGRQMASNGAAKTSDGKPDQEKEAPLDEGEETKAPLPSENLTLAFLAGNTIDRQNADHTATRRYLSKRGWQAEADDHGHLVVHRWVLRGNQFCVVLAEHTTACDVVSVAPDAKAGKTFGARIGTITFGAGPAMPVLRGNVADVPEVMPLIEGLRRRVAGAKTATPLKPAEITKALVGHPLIREGREGDPLRGVFYAADGRWVTTRPLETDGRNAFGGVRVTVGHWFQRGPDVCEDEPGLTVVRHCFKTEVLGGTGFRLQPTDEGTATTLSLLAEDV